MENIEIKLLNKNDESKLIDFLHEEDDSFVVKLSDRVDITEYGKKIIKNARVYAVESNKKIVAIIAYYMNDFKSRVAYLTYICVKKEYQKKHLATKLMNLMIDDCISHNFVKIQLETHIDNGIARKYYEKNGFIAYEIKGNSVFYEREI